MRLSIQLYLLLLFGLSCKTSNSSAPGPTASASPPPKVEFAAQPNAVVVTFDPQSTDTSDSRKITACEASSGNCTDVNTARDQEVLPLPEKGTYTVDISTCQQTQCQPTGQQQIVQIDQTDAQSASINQEIAKLKQTIPSDLASMRRIFTQLQTLYTNAHNDKAQAAMGTLLALNDAALSYLLTDLAELPLSDPTALDLLAQEAQQHVMDPTGSQTNIDSESNSDSNSESSSDSNSEIDTTSTDGTTDSTTGGESSGNSDAITAANGLIGVAVILGTVSVVAAGKFFLSRIHYIKPSTSSNMESPKALTEAQLKSPALGEVGSRVVIFDGVRYQLPNGYTVAAIKTDGAVKYSVLEGGNTRPLGSGSQGTAFAVEGPNREQKIIKFDNTTKKLVISKADQNALRKIEAKFAAEDIGVAKSMEKGFNNPMTADAATVREFSGMHNGKPVNPAGDLFYAKDIPVVIKDRIDGVTLKKALETGDFFKTQKMLNDLQHGLFQRMSKGLMVYQDLNPANLMWNGENWVVIDAKPPKQVASRAEALKGNFKSFQAKVKTTFSQDGIRKFLPVAKYAPEYESRQIQIERNAKFLDYLDGVKTTIIEKDFKSMKQNTAFDNPNTKYVEIQPNKIKIESNKFKLEHAGKLEGKISLGFGILAAGAAITAGILTALKLSAAPTQEQTLLEKLGTLQMKIATTLHTVDAYTAWYVKTEQ